jgi:hypothetical protein
MINLIHKLFKEGRMMKSQMKTTLFFDMEGNVNFEFILQGQTINQAYYVEMLKWLSETVRIKRPEL